MPWCIIVFIMGEKSDNVWLSIVHSWSNILKKNYICCDWWAFKDHERPINSLSTFFLQVRVIDNMADVITQSASANATLIRKLANADGKLMVENARIEGLKSLYSQLNITNEDHKTAFDYLRTLKNKEQTQLAIDFQSYIAGNLGKVWSKGVIGEEPGGKWSLNQFLI